jgi:hypothetical protein
MTPQILARLPQAASGAGKIIWISRIIIQVENPSQPSSQIECYTVLPKLGDVYNGSIRLNG